MHVKWRCLSVLRVNVRPMRCRHPSYSAIGRCWPRCLLRPGASVAITTHQGTAQFPSIGSMVEADLRGWLPVMGVVLVEEQIQRILEEAEHVLSPYVTMQGRVKFDSSAHIVTGTRA